MSESLNLHAAECLEAAAELHRLAAEFSSLGNACAGAKYTARAHAEAERALNVSRAASASYESQIPIHAKVA